MRSCETCRRPDRCIVDYEIKCRPGKCSPQADERAETHHDSCPKLTHEVVALTRVAKLVHTPAKPDGELEYRYRREGWKLLVNGDKTFRYKMLCRKCIENVYDAEARRKDYEKQCKRAMGQDDRTYSQLLAMQSMQ